MNHRCMMSACEYRDGEGRRISILNDIGQYPHFLKNQDNSLKTRPLGDEIGLIANQLAGADLRMAMPLFIRDENGKDLDKSISF